MTAAAPGDQVRVMVSVEVPIVEAFRIFTEEIDQWWRRGRRFRMAEGERGFIRLEPGVGGRLFESFERGGAPVVVETGRVTAWDPPRHLAFAWRAVNFAPTEVTTVEVTFVDRGAATDVTVLHRGWAALPADHPVRHGADVPRFIRAQGLWWGDLLTSLRLRAAAPPV